MKISQTMPPLAVRFVTVMTAAAFVVMAPLESDRARACSVAPPIDIAIDDSDSLACLTWSISEIRHTKAVVKVDNGCLHDVQVDVPCLTDNATECGVETLAPTGTASFEVEAPSTVTWSADQASGSVTINATLGSVGPNACPMGCNAGPEAPSNGPLMIIILVGLAVCRRRTA